MSPMVVTVGDLLDLVVDLTGRTYGGAGGVVDHCFESTGEWATEVLEALGIIVPVDGSGCRFRVRPRAEWPALVARAPGPVGEVVVDVPETTR